MSARTRYPDQWKRILRLSAQTSWTEEDEEEIEYLNKHYFTARENTKKKKKYEDYRSVKVTVLHPDGRTTYFDKKTDATKAIGMSIYRLTRAIETGKPLKEKGWEGCTVEAEQPSTQLGKAFPVRAISPLGEEFRFGTRREASRELGCSRDIIRRSIENDRPIPRGIAKGWRLYDSKE